MNFREWTFQAANCRANRLGRCRIATPQASSPQRCSPVAGYTGPHGRVEKYDRSILKHQHRVHFVKGSMLQQAFAFRCFGHSVVSEIVGLESSFVPPEFTEGKQNMK